MHCYEPHLNSPCQTALLHVASLSPPHVVWLRRGCIQEAERRAARAADELMRQEEEAAESAQNAKQRTTAKQGKKACQRQRHQACTMHPSTLHAGERCAANHLCMSNIPSLAGPLLPHCIDAVQLWAGLGLPCSAHLHLACLIVLWVSVQPEVAVGSPCWKADRQQSDTGQWQLHNCSLWRA